MALELLVSSATEAIFGYLIDKADLGSRLQSYLGRDPDKVAFKLALTRTLNDLTREHPTWVKDLFDEPFLTGGAALLLARYLQPNAPEPTGAELAEAWAAQLNLSPTRAAKYADDATAVSSYFLARLKHHLRDQKALWDLLLMRDIGDMAGQVSAVQIDIAALRTELAQAVSQWQSTLATGGVNISDIADSNLTIIGHIAGRDLYIVQQAPHQRACPTPPARPAVFGGRDEELEAVKQSLRDGNDSAITAVTGGGGIGKTTLAKQVAHDLYNEKVFRSVLWAEVNQAPDPTQLLLEWGKLAEEKFDSKNRSTAALAHAVRDLLSDLIAKECPTCEDNRVLVVLDNVWSDGRDAYTYLRDAAPANSTILLTARAQDVPISLSIPNRHALDYLQPDPAADFLAKYLPTAPRDGLLELADLLGGYPLAMELAASRVNLMAGDAGMNISRALTRAIQNYREGISADHTFAQLHLEQDETKERNLTVSLAYSYNDLAPDDQRRFRQLGVLPLETDFDLKLLEQLWEEEDRSKVEDYCRSLRLAAFISSTDEEGWYRQHRLLRAYARALLEQLNESNSTTFHGMKTLFQVAKVMDRWGLKQRSLKYCEGALDLAIWLGEKQWQAEALNNIGALWDEIGERYKALEYHNQALVLRQMLNDKRGEVITLNNMGIVWSNLGEKRKALTFYERAIVILQSEEPTTKYAALLNNIGGIWSDLGDKRKALEYYDQARMFSEANADLEGMSTTLNNIGNIWSVLGEKEKALEYFEQSLVIRQEMEDKYGEARMLNNIGVIWDELGEKDMGLDFYQQSLAIRYAIGDIYGQAILLNNIGTLFFDLGDIYKALEYYEQALPMLRTTASKSIEGTTLNNMGRIWTKIGENSKALEYYQQALPILRAVENKIGEETTCYNLSLLYLEKGDLDNAIAYIRRCIELEEFIPNDKAERNHQLFTELQKVKSGGFVATFTIYPNEILQRLTENTVAVCTEVADKMDEWQSRVKEIRADFVDNSQEWTNEIALIDALLTILAGNDGTLPPANPYAGVIIQIYAAIDAYYNPSEDQGE